MPDLSFVTNLLAQIWIKFVLAVNWVITQPKQNLVAFVGVAVIFFAANLVMRWGVRTWRSMLAAPVAGKTPSSEVTPPVVFFHLIVITFIYVMGIAIVWVDTDEVRIAKLISAVVLTWMFSLLNLIVVRAWTGGIFHKFIWTLIGAVVLISTYFVIIWVLLQAPVHF